LSAIPAATGALRASASRARCRAISSSCGYLSRYTHRVAISNRRLIAFDERGVTLRFKDYTASDLYALNKVLNEQDFPPLVALHDLLLAAKLARHRTGFLHITKMGKDLLEHSGSLWLLLAQHFLLTAGHDDYLDVEWVSVLNALNFAADAAITDKDFCSNLLSMDEKDYRLKSLAYVHVLRPLCWLGLLRETRDKQSERRFTKTALWSLALTFEDASLPLVMKH
jgi:hypothetical protein